jgi:hypothetical protein
VRGDGEVGDVQNYLQIRGPRDQETYTGLCSDLAPSRPVLKISVYTLKNPVVLEMQKY